MRGPQGLAQVHVIAGKGSDAWVFTTFEVVFEKQHEKVDLISGRIIEYVWNGNGWTMKLADGSEILFPESYSANNMAQGAPTEMRDPNGNRFYVYRAFHKINCYELDVKIAFSSPAIFETDTVKSFNQDLVQRDLKAVLETFEFTN